MIGQRSLGEAEASGVADHSAGSRTGGGRRRRLCSLRTHASHPLPSRLQAYVCTLGGGGVGGGGDDWIFIAKSIECSSVADLWHFGTDPDPKNRTTD